MKIFSFFTISSFKKKNSASASANTTIVSLKTHQAGWLF